MSTKIWTAYVLRDKRQLWPVCKKVRVRAEASVRAELGKLYEEVLSGQAVVPDRPIDEYRSLDGSLGYFGISRYVKDLFGEQLTRSERNEFDLSVSVAIREATDGRILMIPYPGSGRLSGCLEFLRKMPELRDYHYQNSSDKPPHITSRQWAERARTWEPLLRDENWSHMLVLDLVSHAGWHHVCPALALARRALKQEQNDKAARG